MIPCVNGVNSVECISRLAEIDITYVRLAVQHLCYYGCVKLIDIFQFSNIYATTFEINTLIKDPELQASCISLVSRPGFSPPSFGVICKLFCALKGSLTILEWMSENPSTTSQIDIRRFISFGVLKGILHRIHVYPILLSPDESKIPIQIARCLNGKHHLDDLCTRFHKGSKEMQSLLNTSAGSLQYIYG